MSCVDLVKVYSITRTVHKNAATYPNDANMYETILQTRSSMIGNVACLCENCRIVSVNLI